jgi:hypothetical protein
MGDRIGPKSAEKVLTSPSGTPWQEGWTWKCEVCGYEWVPPGEDPTAIAPE